MPMSKIKGEIDRVFTSDLLGALPFVDGQKLHSIDRYAILKNEGLSNERSRNVKFIGMKRFFFSSEKLDST